MKFSFRNYTLECSLDIKPIHLGQISCMLTNGRHLWLTCWIYLKWVPCLQSSTLADMCKGTWLLLDVSIQLNIVSWCRINLSSCISPWFLLFLVSKTYISPFSFLDAHFTISLTIQHFFFGSLIFKINCFFSNWFVWFSKEKSLYSI